MAFLTERFPTNISYGSSGGPGFNTTITVVDTGYEYANINWDQAKHIYDAAMGVRSQDELSDLIRYFQVARGKGHRFRYKDWSDYKSCDVEDDETIIGNAVNFGVGDASETDFSLAKIYSVGGVTNTRPITRPVGTGLGDTTVKIWLDTTLQVEDTDYTLDYDTGIVTFTSPPGAAVVIKWGGQFDVPCRFDTDTIQVNLEFYGHGSLGVPIVEVRE